MQNEWTICICQVGLDISDQTRCIMIILSENDVTEIIVDMVFELIEKHAFK